MAVRDDPVRFRPAGEVFKTPGELAPELSRDEFALYDLIWKRTVASQMADAKKMQMRVDFDAQTNDGKATVFRANGSVITFPGFLAAYDDIVSDENKDEERTEKLTTEVAKSGETVGEGKEILETGTVSHFFFFR